MTQKLLQADRPAVVLAPMEGVTDAPMRALLTERGGFSYCVSEFLRVSQDAPPKKVFLHHVPELKSGGRTPAGIPVQVQILGGDPEKMAEAAQRACEAGAPGVDINFGCPAPTVNRHDGGATLLKYPDRIRSIVEAVRRAVPAQLPVSAKLRLGWDSHDPIHHNAEMAAQGGASWITIHGRTKLQGYAPPAHWEPIGQVQKRLGIPVVANGDIWTFEDFLRCRDVTGSSHFMLGRSAMADPNLAMRISAELGIAPPPSVGAMGEAIGAWLPLLRRFEELCTPDSKGPGYILRRIKQWIRMAKSVNAMTWFETIKTVDSLDELFLTLESALGSLSGEPIRGSGTRAPSQAEALERDSQALPAIPGIAVSIPQAAYIAARG